MIEDEKENDFPEKENYTIGASGDGARRKTSKDVLLTINGQLGMVLALKKKFEIGGIEIETDYTMDFLLM